MLTNKGVIVTGASQGLGKEIARTCVAAGAHVLICARDGAAADAVRAELSANGEPVFAVEADVSNPQSVTALFEAARKCLPNLHGIVNNAGILGPKGSVADTDWVEWVRTVEVNLLGTVLCSRAALPIFKHSGYGKIVNLSGGGATAPMPNLSAYAASKAAVVRFTETLAVECAGQGIDVNAVAPGALNTRMLTEVLEAGPEAVGDSYYKRSLRQQQEGGASLQRAADLCVFLLSSRSDGITGRLISAVWDPWETLPDRLPKFSGTDVYTLRRIVPKDRGLDWE